MCSLIQASLEDLQSKKDMTLKSPAVSFFFFCVYVCGFDLFLFIFKLTYIIISHVNFPFGEKTAETSPAAFFWTVPDHFDIVFVSQ